MKNALLISLVFLLVKNVSFGQENEVHNTNLHYSSGYLFVIYLNNGRMIQTENLISKDDSIVEMISRVETIKRYGVITKAGAIISKAKPNYHFIFINQIFNLFNVANEDRILPVFIDDEYVDRPETIVAEQKEITVVALIKNPLNKGNAIDIITKGYKTSKLIKNTTMPYNSYYLQNNEIADIDAFYSVQ
jgi:hypothetical protein